MKTPTVLFGYGRWLSPLFFILLISCAPSGLSDLQDDLTNARTLWRSTGPASYSYRYQMTCFCPREATREVVITVRNGAVAGAVYADDGEPVDPQFIEHFRTVDALFDILQETINSDPYEMNVSYDPGYGYPTAAFADYDPDIADEELRFVAGSLEPIQDR